MPRGDELLTTIEAVHAAGLDAECWPNALGAVARLFGAAGAMFEIFDVPSRQPIDLRTVGIPPADQIDYVEHYAPLSSRTAYGLSHPRDLVIWDYKILDENEMERDPYYVELLGRTGYRYFISAQALRTSNRAVIISAQRSPRQGHIEKADIAAMHQLLPHVRQAFDTEMRLKRADVAGRALESALHWLADGVALVRADGAIVYANDALQAMFRRNDGLRTVKGTFEFLAPESRSRFSTALAAIAKLRADRTIPSALTDLAVPRGPGLPPYLLSVRPLVGTARNRDLSERAVAIVFIRDPLNRNPAATQVLREVFGFTEAEANLARALQAGVAITTYARDRAVSVNTAYTHLRRLKEKTGCKRMAELIRRLNDLQVRLRPD